MQSSRFTVRRDLPACDAVFLWNTLTDAEAVVSADTLPLLDGRVPATADERRDAATLRAHGFLTTPDEDARALAAHFDAARHDAHELRLTVLTTEQCNFACAYCIQGSHSAANASHRRMTADTAAATVSWFDQELARTSPASAHVTFFGGEPLLNMPALMQVAEGTSRAARARGIAFGLSLVTNGALLTPAVVEALNPFGLAGVKVTLDGDREAHDEVRAFVGGRGSFTRIINNIAAVAHRCRVSIGINLPTDDRGAVDRLMTFLRAQPFASAIADISVTPLVESVATDASDGLEGHITAAASTAPAVASSSSACASCSGCHVADAALIVARDCVRAAGFRVHDDLAIGPCDVHRRHALTVGVDGELYDCPGFATRRDRVIGHVGAPSTSQRRAVADLAAQLATHALCSACAFQPICAGGCAVAAAASGSTAPDPVCHKPVFEHAVTRRADLVSRTYQTAQGAA